MRTLSDLQFGNQFAQLGEEFFARVQPTAISAPYLVAHSPALFSELNFAGELIQDHSFLDVFSGNQLATGSLSLAAVYSGHQFGVWAGQLGDGRALLLGDLSIADKSEKQEFQLKGAGITPFSRSGDGRAVLRSSIREFLCSEAMAGLGIPTTRALCVIGSEQRVLREQVEKTAIVTRVAPSFIRFGSFEHMYYQGKGEQLRELADFLLQQHYPELQDDAQPYAALLRNICERTARLIAQWQSVGFMHGVMNTDNMSVLGLTLDYGPFGFMDGYDAQHICNHSDTSGRYRYELQPQIGQWNCHALAQAMLPLIGDVDTTQEALSTYVPTYEARYQELMLAKLGLISADATMREQDTALLEKYLELMARNRSDYTLSFRRLSQITSGRNASADDLAAQYQQERTLLDLFLDRESVQAWLQDYRTRLQRQAGDESARQQAMNRVNPKFILRNHLAQQAIEKAEQHDFSEVRKLLDILTHPFDEQEENAHYAKEAPEWAKQLSISCSS
ncbi:MAG: YdiU family protein [Burkholderiales bacterium]|nr:YdiU family protein [Burkholderiales bacterium]